MSGIVIYGSKYGTTKQYAEELARRTGFEVKAYDDAYDINGYEPIAYIGALYAGGVLGMKKTIARLTGFQGEIVIATVGLADPTDPENVANIEEGMKAQLPKDVFESAHVFHLRGGIDYSKLSFKHKTMMKLLCKKAENLPEEEKNAEVRAMLETYGKRVNFVNFDSLDQIVAVL